MQTVFLELLKLSLIGSLFAAAVMLVRLVFHRAPKWLFCVLWGVVALRLICPVSIESKVSLIPEGLASGQIIAGAGSEYIGDVDILYESNAGYISAVEAGRQPVYSGEGYYVVTEKDSLEAPRTVGETVYPILSWIWAAGMMLMLAYTAISYLLLRRKMEEATHLRENIWQCEQVDSPFVLGFLKPRIYLPYAITDSDMANVIAHEQAHIRRKDHWWKPVGFLLLSIHWFNPVLWLAYILLCRDIEAACDEKVIRRMEKDEMRAYSAALLHCSVHRRRIAACPLAFGETGVKERIKRVMNYKKPAFWIVAAAVLVSVIVACCFLTEPANGETTPDETAKQEPPLTIVSRGEVISPYLHHAYSEFWDGKGFLCADGIPVGEVLPQLESEGGIPRGEYSRDFRVLLGDNARITHILLFDEKFDPLDTIWDIGELSKLKDGNYYVGIVVNKEGEYIQEVGRNECAGWVCVVRLLVNSEESTAAGSTGINLSYCGNKDNSIMIEDAAACAELMAFIKKAGGERGASTKGCYGAVYTLTVSLEGEKEPLRFSLWNDGTYSTSRHTDSEGYDYFYNGDISDFYQYLEEKYPAEFWYPDMTDPAFDITVAYGNYADWEALEEFYARACNRDTFTQSFVLHLPIYQLDTQADLAEFKGAVDGILSVDRSYDEIPSFNTATAKYDEAFFEENSLMVVYVTASSGSWRFGVDSVAFDNGRFCVHVKQTNRPEIFTEDMAGWFITVAIPDQMAKACYTFDAHLDKLQNRNEVPGAGVHVVDIWDRTITEQIGCDTALEKFWEDEANEYYFGCIKSRYVMVMDSTGRTVDVVTALKEGLITVETLDHYSIKYITEPKSGK